jgi:hypothetical protein
MSPFIILLLTFITFLWILRASKYRVNGIVSADILVSCFFIIYISIPLLMFSVFSTYPEHISLNFYLFSFLCLLLFIAPWHLLYRKKLSSSSFLTVSTINSFSQPLLTNWLIYLVILSISSICHLVVKPSEYGFNMGGTFAIALFFVRLARPLLILSTVLWFYRRVKSHLFFMFYVLVLTLPFILSSGRRSDTFFLPIVFLVAAVITNKIRLPRFFIIIFILFGLIVFNFLPLIRSSSGENQVIKYNAFNPLEALVIKYTSFSEESEAAYAAIRFQVSSESGVIDWFAPVFNAFSTQFISSTLFGDHVKESATMYVHSLDDRCNLSKFCQAYSIPSYWWYAPTGFLEVFDMFSYGGCLLFGIAGYFIFKFSALADKVQLMYQYPSPYLVVLISLAPLIIYTGLSFFILQVTIYVIIIKIVTLR